MRELLARLLGGVNGALSRQDTGDAGGIPPRVKKPRRISTQSLDHSENAMTKRALAAQSHDTHSECLLQSSKAESVRPRHGAIFAFFTTKRFSRESRRLGLKSVSKPGDPSDQQWIFVHLSLLFVQLKLDNAYTLSESGKPLSLRGNGVVDQAHILRTPNGVSDLWKYIVVHVLRELGMPIGVPCKWPCQTDGRARQNVHPHAPAFFL